MMASANPTPCAFPGPIGSGGRQVGSVAAVGMEIEGKAGGEYGGGGSCWLLCVVVVVVTTVLASYFTGRKVEIKPAKMANFLAFITKNASLPYSPGHKRVSTGTIFRT
jgi:hypothetical protein